VPAFGRVWSARDEDRLVLRRLLQSLVQDAKILWSTGEIWNKNLHIDGATATGQSIAIEVRPDQILLFNPSGPSSRARLVDAQTIYAVDWRITGHLTGDQILWSNGITWKDFGWNNLNAAFSDVVTYAFPNILLKGKDGKSPVSIELRQSAIFVTNKSGQVSPAKLIAPGTILAVNWNITGKLKNGNIYWSNGTVWQGFDAALISYIFGM
jgi:hypothetical protein